MASAQRGTPRSIDCTACGACCFNDDQRYIQLWSVDRERLGPSLEVVAVERDSQWFLRMTDGHCSALAIGTTVGPDGASNMTFHCTVYESRPDACRAFEQGSRGCEQARAIDVPRARLVRRPEPR